MGEYIYEVMSNSSDQFREELESRAQILKNAIDKKDEPEPDYIYQFCSVTTCEFNPMHEIENVRFPIVDL
jgi:hypothetical protein